MVTNTLQLMLLRKEYSWEKKSLRLFVICHYILSLILWALELRWRLQCNSWNVYKDKIVTIPSMRSCFIKKNLKNRKIRSVMITLAEVSVQSLQKSNRTVFMNQSFVHPSHRVSKTTPIKPLFPSHISSSCSQTSQRTTDGYFSSLSLCWRTPMGRSLTSRSSLYLETLKVGSFN